MTFTLIEMQMKEQQNIYWKIESTPGAEWLKDVQRF